jgi:arylformamidase
VRFDCALLRSTRGFYKKEFAMTIYDISLSISPNLPTWPGDPGLILEQYESIDKGALYNATQMSSSVHLGTHVDAPRHFLNDGPTVEQLLLEVLTGPCYVTQLPDGIEAITSEVLDRTEITSDMKRVLFGTSNSHYWAKGESKFQTDFVAITEDGAEWLVERGVQLVGIDYLSVAPYDESIPTHTVLLKAGVIIVEGLNLSKIMRGFYDLYCLPLKIAGSDGAPARAILVQSK